MRKQLLLPNSTIIADHLLLAGHIICFWGVAWRAQKNAQLNTHNNATGEDLKKHSYTTPVRPFGNKRNISAFSLFGLSSRGRMSFAKSEAIWAQAAVVEPSSTAVQKPRQDRSTNVGEAQLMPRPIKEMGTRKNEIIIIRIKLLRSNNNNNN